MELTPDYKTRAISVLIEEFFEHVLPEEEPIFIGDEATILDVSMASTEELLRKCSEYYRTSVGLEDLRRPLWQVLPELDAHRGKLRNPFAL